MNYERKWKSSMRMLFLCRKAGGAKLNSAVPGKITKTKIRQRSGAFPSGRRKVLYETENEPDKERKTICFTPDLKMTKSI